MQIVVGPVKQAAQSRCSLWPASQNTCWRWGSEQRASSHSSMWFYFSSVWAQWRILWSMREPQTERGKDWKCLLKTPASWNAHAQSTQLGMPSGPYSVTAKGVLCFIFIFRFYLCDIVCVCVCVCVLSQEKIKIKNPWRVSSKKLLVMSKKSDVIIFNQTSLYSMHCFLKWPCLIYHLLSVSLMLIREN